MDVELPSTGCNIINSATSFYNYTNNDRTRSLYYIYDGKALLANTQTSNTGYNYTGSCLSTGDITYKPELKVWFPLVSVYIFLTVFILIYKVMLKRLLP